MAKFGDKACGLLALCATVATGFVASAAAADPVSIDQQASLSHIHDPVPLTDRQAIQQYGAPLCNWMIAISTRAATEGCGEGDQSANIAALDRAIARMNAFNAEHSERFTLEQITESASARVAEELAEYRDNPALCEGDAKYFYGSEARPDEIDAWAETSTSVPRPIVADPCL